MRRGAGDPGAHRTASVAWWTSSGSSNFTAATGSATQIASSSRTVLGYFTGSPATPVTHAAGQTLAFSATITWSGFDDGTAAGLSNFHVGLLRSVANPAATSGTGFTASGSPNTAARVTGDYGSSFPSSGVFARYEGKEGEILRYVFWHSVALAALVGILVTIQARLG